AAARCHRPHGARHYPRRGPAPAAEHQRPGQRHLPRAGDRPAGRWFCLQAGPAPYQGVADCLAFSGQFYQSPSPSGRAFFMTIPPYRRRVERLAPRLAGGTITTLALGAVAVGCGVGKADHGLGPAVPGRQPRAEWEF
nr:hypothetical protein [Tanacetum cinerariifolium]